ncbi:MAG: tRNA uridine-5-carboxymethylaminomethyl(34) synthesis GTPase MnmE [Rhizobiales bacterium]|nr:tRNA uridine-5-carboxymethylaminomethyl(34) synthesis GTPase MnmE [Hyphomicrobiales bacterium]
MMERNTIFALSSGPPPAGVAVIRLSGPKTRFGLETLIDSIPEPRRATLRSVRFRGTEIDRALIIYMPGPASFSGEDMAELHIHGGRAVIAALLDALGTLSGFRAAESGEFTRRAFLNGRLDLTEVEGMADLIAAETEAQRRQALRQADGTLRKAAESWRERLVRARALIEAELDFADEEDVPGAVSDRIWPDVSNLAEEISVALAGADPAERLRDGAEIVILGPPNAGKSTLLNALARREVAIVTPEPGTTRDLIEVRLDIGGYPVTLVDTAGLRDAAGAVEAEGVRRAEKRAASADFVLWLGEAGSPLPAPPVAAPILRVGTKTDALDSSPQRALRRADFDVLISARTGEGLDSLLARLGDFLRERFAPAESSLITRARHRSCLIACRDAAIAAGRPGPLELRAEELRRATDALGRLVGAVDVDDMLDVIFREFCIGK